MISKSTSTKKLYMCAHTNDVFSPLYEVLGFPKERVEGRGSPPPRPYRPLLMQEKIYINDFLWLIT